MNILDTEIVNTIVTLDVIGDIAAGLIIIAIFLFYLFREAITDFIFSRRDSKRRAKEYADIAKSIPDDAKSIFDE